MKLSVKAGSTSQTVNIFVMDSTSATGAGLTGLVFNAAGLKAYYAFPRAAAAAITLATLAAVTSAWSSGGFKEIDPTNMPGWYRLDIPDAALAAASGRFVSIHLTGAANMAPLPLEIELTGWDNQDAVRGGMTALPNAAAEAAGGLYTRGSGAGQINQAANGQVDVNTVKVSGTVQTAGDIPARLPAALDANGFMKSDVEDWKAATAPAMTGDAFARLGAPAGASVSADIAAVQADTDNIQTRLPAALVSGRIDASVGAYQSGLVPLQPTVAGRTLNVSTGGIGDANLAQILATALTEAAGGRLAAAFKKWFDVASPTGTVNSIPDHVAGAANGLLISGVNVGDVTIGGALNISGDMHIGGSFIVDFAFVGDASLVDIGSVTGNVNGDLFGNVQGAINGSVQGNVDGNVNGKVLGGGAGVLVAVGVQSDVEQWRTATPNVLIGGRVDADAEAVGVGVNVLTIEGVDATDQIRDAILNDATRFAGADIALIKGRLPSALVGGRMDSSVGAVANGAITAAAIATDAIDADAIAADAVTEIQAGLATAFALAGVQADTDDIQSRLPAALVGGRMDSSVGAYQTGLAPYTPILFSDVAGTGSSGTSVKGTVAGANDDAFDGAVMLITSGTNINEMRRIIAYVATSKTYTIDLPWLAGAISAGVTFVILAQYGPALNTSFGVQANVTRWNNTAVNAVIAGRIDASVGAVAANAITAAAIATDAIDADAIAADAVAEIQAGLATASALAAVQADTDDIQSRLPAALDVNGFMKSDVEDWKAATAPAMTGDAFARLGAPAGASVSADIAAVQADTDNIQTRLPAALVGGKMDSHVNDIASGAITAAALNTSAIDALVDAVWDEAIAGHLGAGSTGAALNAAGSAGDPWVTPLPGAYGAGTAGNLVGTLLDAAISSRAVAGDAMTLTAGERTAIANALLDLAAAIDSYTPREIMRVLAAVLAGKVSGGPQNPVFRAIDDSKVRLSATADGFGDRTAITIDAT